MTCSHVRCASVTPLSACRQSLGWNYCFGKQISLTISERSWIKHADVDTLWPLKVHQGEWTHVWNCVSAYVYPSLEACSHYLQLPGLYKGLNTVNGVRRIRRLWATYLRSVQRCSRLGRFWYTSLFMDLVFSLIPRKTPKAPERGAR